jgi:outer membrane protein insertion porin family
MVNICLQRFFHWGLILFGGLLISGCSNLRYLDEDQKLYTGSSVKIESEESIDSRREIIREAERVITPKPNWKFLIWRPRLWLYNIGGEIGLWGTGRWIQENIGRPPVLMEDMNTEKTAELIENRVFNMGHFEATVEHEIRERRKRASVDYFLQVRPAYRIRSIILPEDDRPIVSDIRLSMEESDLREGNIFRLDQLIGERERIDRFLKERGYFYFYPNYLLFQADSSAGTRKVDLRLTIVPATPPEAFLSYKIRHIVIETGRPGYRDSETGIDEKVEIRDGIFTDPGRDVIRPRTLLRALFIDNEKIYSYSDHAMTISHLMGMRVFRFANIRFNRVPGGETGENNYLDARIILTPREQMAVSMELRGVSKSNNFAGPGFTASFNNRNLLGGAENLNIQFNGAFETLLGETGISATEVGVSTGLSVHRLLIPVVRMRSRFSPSTSMSLSFNYMDRTDAFSLSTIRSDFGYVMSPDVNTRLSLTPFVFNAFTLGTIAPEFERVFSREVLLRRGLFEQFLLGSEYSYTYNSKLTESGVNDWFVNFNLDMAGNLTWLMMNNLGMGKAGEDGQYTIFNQGFSQFSRTWADVRYYRKTGTNNMVAVRLITGIGIPYGNSDYLPHIKQFIIGGSHSIRAFHPRRLGPGTYSSPEDAFTSLNIYQGGEIKLETNLEYRFGGGIVRGAVFADAGNIWNLREQDEVPGGEFNSSDFLRQMALGTGAGLRLDFNFFLLRLDLAFPLAIPYETDTWFERIRPLDAGWRRDNLILNLAIGYPF